MSMHIATRVKQRIIVDSLGSAKRIVKPDLPVLLEDATLQFQDQLYALRVFAWLRWPDGVKCIHCGSSDPGFLSTRNIWKCRSAVCRKQFSARRDTLLEDSPIYVGDWLTVLWLLANQRGGITSYDLKERLGVTQKTGWLMLKRIRLALQYLHEAGSPIPKRARTEADRFARFTSYILQVTTCQLSQEEADVEAGKPLSNPYARRGPDRATIRQLQDSVLDLA